MGCTLTDFGRSCVKRMVSLQRLSSRRLRPPGIVLPRCPGLAGFASGCGAGRHPRLAASGLGPATLRLVMVETKWMAKRAMAPLMALAGVILYRYLIGLGLTRTALPAVVAAAPGSSLWSAGSQAVWQRAGGHAPVVALALSHPNPVPRLVTGPGGIGRYSLFASRLIDVLFAVVIMLWVAVPASGPWLVPARTDARGSALIAYNLWFFGTIAGGQAQLELLHTQFHGVAVVGQPAHGGRRYFVQPQPRPVHLQSLDCRGFGDRRRAGGVATDGTSSPGLLAALGTRTLLHFVLEIRGLVGRALLLPALLDRRGPPIRHPVGV